jgi:hypothetical protein
MKTLNQNTLRQLIKYDHKTGLMIWRYRDKKWFTAVRQWKTWNKLWADQPCFINQRSQIKIFGELWSASGVIWKIATGKSPKHFIDHKDRNPHNNKWKNLRPATRSQNNANTTRPRRKSGFRWVYCNKRGGWVVMVNKKYLGYYADLNTAIKIARKAAKQKYGEFYTHD